MTTILDLDPPAGQLIRLLDGVRDDRMTAPTPCAEYTVGDLLDHLMNVTVVFRGAATKTATTGGPSGSAARLPADWRARLPRQLDALVVAWRDPAAWEGVAEAGGVELPAEVMGGVALDELVLHGWDLARATGQPFTCDAHSAEACLAFTSAMSAPGEDASREGLFGPVVPVPPGAPVFDRVLGYSGRDPSWTPDAAPAREPG
ncbi:TIGR03086 family metal-binding protein [Pseudonocardia bannensis]|uniref:TIGR03086 family protein n=1 Tax=Pseudonocardia bannensis TaxID=630973 RepID=A0A848DK32_9PSEU|nr:TIGR03086 family metal-binding protein [Pseudonocardia bannensis]NMH93077.1 TIGR03086 family protein [Pseudonocardia bannensis]